MQPHLGELAALGTAGCWVVTALAFESAGKRIGSLSLNLIRLMMALIPLSLWGLIGRGHALPVDADAHAWLWLSLSALVGFVFGDLCLFRAFVLLGPRLSTLIMASAPVWAALLSYLLLGETLTGLELVGMALTLAGIGWAVSQRPATPPGPGPSAPPEPGPNATESQPESQPERREPGPRRWRLASSGLAMAFGGALGQAGGLVLSKHGMGSYDPFAATQIRVMVAVVGFALVASAAGWWPRIATAVRDRAAMGPTALGAIFGPFLGVGLSLVAIQLAPTGVAASLMATTPVLMLPVSWFRGERFGWGGALGAMFAVAGVAMLML